MRFFLGMMLGLLSWYAGRYFHRPAHRYQPGDLEDREWDEAIKRMAKRGPRVVPLKA